jgi:uncharacterized protein (DUF1697 family)
VTVFIALLQGVNVGKYKRISMADLKQIVIDAGGEQPVTVANSGNVMFAYRGNLTAEALRTVLEAAISAHVGMPVPTVLRTGADMQSVVRRNPYPNVSDPKCLHVEFLLEPAPDALAGIEYGEDHLTASGSEIYLHAPNRMSGITYDAKTLYKRLGTHHTSRNWSTVAKLAHLAAGMARNIE